MKSTRTFRFHILQLDGMIDERFDDIETINKFKDIVNQLNLFCDNFDTDEYLNKIYRKQVFERVNIQYLNSLFIVIRRQISDVSITDNLLFQTSVFAILDKFFNDLKLDLINEKYDVVKNVTFLSPDATDYLPIFVLYHNITGYNN